MARRRSSRSVHVVRRSSSKRWGVRKASSSRAIRLFRTQRAAIKYGRTVAKRGRGELFIHSVNGRIRDRRSFGNDPHPPKG